MWVLELQQFILISGVKVFYSSVKRSAGVYLCVRDRIIPSGYHITTAGILITLHACVCWTYSSKQSTHNKSTIYVNNLP